MWPGQDGAGAPLAQVAVTCARLGQAGCCGLAEKVQGIQAAQSRASCPFRLEGSGAWPRPATCSRGHTLIACCVWASTGVLLRLPPSSRGTACKASREAPDPLQPERTAGRQDHLPAAPHAHHAGLVLAQVCGGPATASDSWQ